MPDKHEVDGSIPFEPTTLIKSAYYIWNYKRVVQEKRGKIFGIVRLYIEKNLTKFDTAIRSLEFSSKHIEKYIDKCEKN